MNYQVTAVRSDVSGRGHETMARLEKVPSNFFIRTGFLMLLREANKLAHKVTITCIPCPGPGPYTEAGFRMKCDSPLDIGNEFEELTETKET